MEKVVIYMKCQKDENVGHIVYMLKGCAYDWSQLQGLWEMKPIRYYGNILKRYFMRNTFR